MLVTGIILAPTAIATPALHDFAELGTVINAAANAIGDQNNPNRGFGFNFLSGGGQMGTADLVNNVTTTLLRTKFQLDTNKTSWLLPMAPSNGTNSSGTALPWTPTLPLTSSLVLPTTVPTTTPTMDNITTDLSIPYIDYISSIPNLSTSLTSLGRSYHREMNSPVHEAIAGLQQSISALQSAMLQSDLIRPNAVIRTIRASSSLEDAQQAWSRFLNLPGNVSGPAANTGSAGNYDMDLAPPRLSKREAAPFKFALTKGQHYTHKELWGRREREAETEKLTEGKGEKSDAAVEWQEQHGKGHEVVQRRPYVA